MILLLGERVHDRDLSEEQVESWRRRWEERPFAFIMRTPAMVAGPTRQRLLGIVSIRPGRTFQIVNLLPPDNVIGTWDDDLAELCAMHFLLGIGSWQQHHPADPLFAVFLLGRRVMEAVVDRLDVQFGEEVDLCGVPALCLPHPSGRSRYLNDEDYRSRTIHQAEKFLRRVSK